MAKKIKELFTFTLTEIAASVRCLSSMIVVLNAKFAPLLAARANKKTVRNEEAFFLQAYWTGKKAPPNNTLIASLYVVGGVDNKVPQLHATQSEPLDYLLIFSCRDLLFPVMCQFFYLVLSPLNINSSIYLRCSNLVNSLVL